MANKLLTSDIIAKTALVLLKNKLVMAPLVYRQHEKVFGKVGETIRIEKPHRVKSTSGATLAVQPLVDITVPFKVEHQETVGLDFTTRDMTLSIENFSSKYLASGVAAIANKIDRSLLLELKKAYHSVGTPGTTPSTHLAFANAAAKMTTYATPMDGMRRGVLNPFTCAGLSNDVTRLNNDKMVRDAWRTGQVAKVAGLDLFESNNVPTHTTGKFGSSPRIYQTQTNGSTITTDGWGTANNSGVFLVGDVFTIAGVFGVNPQSYESTGKLLEFVVTANTNTDSSSRATVTFSPEMNDGTATMLNGAGESVSIGAYQNVSELPIDNAVITPMGTASTTYEQNYLFHRDAVSLAMINLEPPASAVVKESVYDPDSGLAMLMTKAYDVNAGSERTRLEAVWATGLLYPDLAYRMWGASQ